MARQYYIEHPDGVPEYFPTRTLRDTYAKTLHKWQIARRGWAFR